MAIATKKKIPAGKSTERFNLLTETRYTDVIVGGQLTLSTEDARGLYDLTTLKRDEDERNTQYEECRYILRNIAKKILFTAGASTSKQDLMDMFSQPEVEKENATDHPINGRISLDES